MAIKPESLDKVARSTYARLVKHFKDMGVDVPEIDDPSAEAGLFGVQALQSLDAAVTAHNEKSVRAEDVAGHIGGGGGSGSSLNTGTGKK